MALQDIGPCGDMRGWHRQLPGNAADRLFRGFYLDQFLRQEEFDVFLNHREFFNIGRFRRSQECNDFRDQDFRS